MTDNEKTPTIEERLEHLEQIVLSHNNALNTIKNAFDHITQQFELLHMIVKTHDKQLNPDKE